MKKTVVNDLPDDIMQQCLARVSLTSIAMAKNVCKHWNKIATTYRLFKLRKLLGLTEPCIFSVYNKYEKSLYRGLQVCLLGVISSKSEEKEGDEHNKGDDQDPVEGILFPIRRSCSVLEGPQRLQFGATASADGMLLYVIGGRSPLISRKPGAWMVFDRVDVYDPALNRLHQSKPIKCARYACGIGSYVDMSKGMNLHLIIVAGGYDVHGYALSSAEIYNSILDEWESIPDMERVSGACRGFGVGGKFFVTMANSGPNAMEVYDSSLKAWKTVAHQELTHYGLSNCYINWNSVGINIVLNL